MKQKVESTIEFIDGNNEHSVRHFFEQWYEIIHSQKPVEYTHTHNGVDYIFTIEGFNHIESVKVCDE